MLFFYESGSGKINIYFLRHNCLPERLGLIITRRCASHEKDLLTFFSFRCLFDNTTADKASTQAAVDTAEKKNATKVFHISAHKMLSKRQTH